jgi:hypothetical protein
MNLTLFPMQEAKSSHKSIIVELTLRFSICCGRIVHKLSPFFYRLVVRVDLLSGLVGANTVTTIINAGAEGVNAAITQFSVNNFSE